MNLIRALCVMVLPMLLGGAAGDAPRNEGFSGQSVSGWSTSEEASQLYGTKTYGAVLYSLNSLSSPIGLLNAKLIVGCVKGVIAVGVQWPMPVPPPQDVRWSFDNGPVQSQTWSNTSAYTTSSPTPRDFLSAMAHAHHLVIGTSNYGGLGPVEVSFDLDGGMYAFSRQTNAQQVFQAATSDCP